MRFLSLLAVFAVFFVVNANAAGYQEYRAQKREILAKADRCDLIGAREILALSQMKIGEISAGMDDIRQRFVSTSRERLMCYDKALTTMDAFLGVAQSGEFGNVPASIKDMDTGLLEMLKARRSLTGRLLDSMLSDLEDSAAAGNDDSYPKESAKTQRLVKEDMALVMEIERRQLAADDLFETLLGVYSLGGKLAQAHHAMSKSLLVFEDAENLAPLPRFLARLKSEFAPAAALIDEVVLDMAMGAAKDAQTMRNGVGLNRKFKQTMVDIDIAAEESKQGIMPDRPEDVISVLYERLSGLSGGILALATPAPKADTTQVKDEEDGAEKG